MGTTVVSCWLVNSNLLIMGPHIYIFIHTQDFNNAIKREQLKRLCLQKCSRFWMLTMDSGKYSWIKRAQDCVHLILHLKNIGSFWCVISPRTVLEVYCSKTWGLQQSFDHCGWHLGVGWRCWAAWHKTKKLMDNSKYQPEAEQRKVQNDRNSLCRTHIDYGWPKARPPQKSSGNTSLSLKINLCPSCACICIFLNTPHTQTGHITPACLYSMSWYPSNFYYFKLRNFRFQILEKTQLKHSSIYYLLTCLSTRVAEANPTCQLIQSACLCMRKPKYWKINPLQVQERKTPCRRFQSACRFYPRTFIHQMVLTAWKPVMCLQKLIFAPNTLPVPTLSLWKVNRFHSGFFLV